MSLLLLLSFIVISISIVALDNKNIFFVACKLSNATTGTMSNCKIDCCEGDFCNADNATDTAGRIFSLVTSFVIVLLALFLNLFPGA